MKKSMIVMVFFVDNCMDATYMKIHEEMPLLDVFICIPVEPNEWSHRRKCQMPHFFVLRIALYSPAFLQGMLLGSMMGNSNVLVKKSVVRKKKIWMEMDGLIMLHHVFYEGKHEIS